VADTEAKDRNLATGSGYVSPRDRVSPLPRCPLTRLRQRAAQFPRLAWHGSWYWGR
jgi:hypothetical protein